MDLEPDRVDERSARINVVPHIFLEYFLHADFDISREKPWPTGVKNMRCVGT